MFQRYLLSSVLRSPDEPSGDAAVIEPVVEAPAGDPAAEPVLEVQPTPPPAPPSNDPPWYLKRIAQEASKAERNETARIAAERARDEAVALAERLQAGKETPPPQQREQRQPQQTDYNSDVQKAAAQQVLYNDIAEIDRMGKATLGAPFVEAVNILRAVGGTTDEFLSDVLAAVDKRDAPALLSTIAQDPEKAAGLAQMNSRQRIAELTRMSVAVAAKPVADEPALVPAKVAPKAVSKAPAPAPVVQPSASKTVDWRADAASDEDFHKGWEAHQAERMKTRRR
jgi:hypothetical protein